MDTALNKTLAALPDDTKVFVSNPLNTPDYFVELTPESRGMSTPNRM